MLDRQSEIIAHFIGQFDQATETVILRMHYDEVRAARAAEQEPNTLLHVGVNISAEMGLTDFAPDVHFGLPSEALPGASAPAIALEWLMPVRPLLGRQDHLDVEVNHTFPVWSVEQFVVAPVFELAPPGSQVTVAIQANWLLDDDILMMRSFDLPEDVLAARSQAAIDARFEALVGAAGQLDPFGIALTDEGAFATSHTVGAALGSASAVHLADAPEGAQVALHWSSSHAAPGGDPVPGGNGVLIDGVLAETVPDTLILRLEDRAGEVDDTDADEPTQGAGAAEQIHQIQTGENLLVNEAGLSINWVDAPTIAVAGALHHLTMISQINVWSDRDDVFGTSAGAAPGTEALNVADVSHQSNTVDPFGASAHDGGPLTYAIAEIAGDLVLRSYTVQITLVSDDDTVSFVTTFHEVEIGLGANVAANVFLIQGFQYGFEAILVGGDMINLVSLMQLNILNDDDLVAAAPGTAGELSTAGNLMWNEAHVGWTGIDTESDMTEGMAAALASLTGNGTFDPFSLDGEAFLAGSEVGILLTIGGDFINEHHLVQINMLSDADTVQLHAAELAEAGWDRIDVETGGNVLANLAEVSVNGIDSAVMAGGGVYSDVVIYQAGMYDDGSLDLESGGDGAGAALATEAVAFLVDGMIEPGGGPDNNGGGADWGPQGCGSGTHDSLSAMVS